MKSLWQIIALLLVASAFAAGQSAQEKVDSAANAQIRDEGMNRSQVMEILSYLTDVYGPRLTGSPGYIKAAEWAKGKLTSFGVENSHLEPWGFKGKGWTLKKYSANVISSQNFPLISYPKAWSPNVEATGELLFLDAKTDSALNLYKGKLKGKYVLLSDPREIKAHFDPEATRDADSSLLKMANAENPRDQFSLRQMMRNQSPEAKMRALVSYHKLEMATKEGALGILTMSGGDGGNVYVQQASVPAHPDTPFTARVSAYEKGAPKIVPQFAVGAEHYNRLVRMIQKGEHPKLDIELDAAFNNADSVSNIIGEIPGSDLKDEIVMIGAHFDSWHGGTGATDNGTGSAVCMEAMRILKALKLQPRRTIRIGLWGGEEQGLLGSSEYVKAHFGERKGQQFEPGGEVTYKPESDKFSAYFNNDNGSGKVRGVYMETNEAARPIFRAWLAPFKDLGASTLTLQRTGGTDHQSFDRINLPAFQFIQDELEYGTRTHHSTMDVWDRAQSDDLKQAAVLMAAFAYDAAMRDAKFPRKPVPAPTVQAGGR